MPLSYKDVYRCIHVHLDLPILPDIVTDKYKTGTLRTCLSYLYTNILVSRTTIMAALNINVSTETYQHLDKKKPRVINKRLDISRTNLDLNLSLLICTLSGGQSRARGVR